MPSQAPNVVSCSPGVARYTSHRGPRALASSTFLQAPMVKRWTPEANFSTVCSRCSSWSSRSLYLMMGPAMSWGNRVTKVPKVTMFFWHRASPRYTSMV